MFRLIRQFRNLFLSMMMMLSLLAIGSSGQSVPVQAGAVLTLDEAVRLALGQASLFEQAKLNERIAAEDVKQARAAFLPRVVSPLSIVYTTPSSAEPLPGSARVPSFIAANAVGEYQALAGMAGELDVAGRLRAGLKRSRALLEAAHAGTEVARRDLVQAVTENYYGLALATARRRVAEQALAAAEEFERITGLLVNGGEVAQVDLIRARLQTASRRDEMEQARANEAAVADILRSLTGQDFDASIQVIDLLTMVPEQKEIDRYAVTSITTRPEFSQFDAVRRAAEQEISLARSDRRPQLVYSINGGFDSDTVRSAMIREHLGGVLSLGLTIPIFDWGSSKSRERQARLRIQSVETDRALSRRIFTQQFNTSHSQAVSAMVRYRIVNSSIADAEKNVTTSIARYRAGEASIIEVTDAQGTLASQRAALAQALYDFQVSAARLKTAAGQ
jgi:outer membrane protein TolC